MHTFFSCCSQSKGWSFKVVDNMFQSPIEMLNKTHIGVGRPLCMSCKSSIYHRSQSGGTRIVFPGLNATVLVQRNGKTIHPQAWLPLLLPPDPGLHTLL